MVVAHTSHSHLIMRHLLLAALTALVLVSQVETASAQPGMTEPFGPIDTPPLKSAEVKLSYKRSVIISDSIAGGMFGFASIMIIPCVASAFSSDGSDGDGACTMAAVGAIGGLGTFVLGAPLVHLSNGNPSSAGISLALRIGLPAIGVAAAQADEDLGSLLVLSGVGLAMAIDWAVLSKHKKPKKERKLLPTVQPVLGGLQVGLGGSF